MNTQPLVSWLLGEDSQQKNAASRRSIREDFVRTYPGWIQAPNNLAAASFELDAAREQAPQRLWVTEAGVSRRTRRLP